MSKMARFLLIVITVLVIQTVCQAQILTRPCNGATPLKDANNTDLFCGRGPDRVDCPPGSRCDIHPADLYAKCCPRRPVTPAPCYGEKPLTNSSTGRPYNCMRSRCPRGSLCHAHPADAFAVCCRRLPCKGKGPLTDSRGRDLFCGLGGQRCPSNSYCDVHPVDIWAKCCRDPLCANRKPGVSFGNARCTQKCICNKRGMASCVPICPQILIRCQKFYMPKFFKVRVPGTNCTCPSARCVPVTPRPCFGDKPLMDPRTGRPYSCFRSRCPSGAFCHAHPADAFAVCCRKHAKPGRCPKNRVVTPCRIVRATCISDRQCPGNKKCCRRGCSTTCLSPLPCGPVCAIYCKYGNVYKDGCPTCKCRENPCNLVDCPLQRPRCIVVNREARCVRPVVVAKPGRCPKNGVIGICGILKPGCISDRLCPGNKKCCRFGCTTMCRTPIPCGPVCEIVCRYGKVIKNGCPICKCRENPCNRVNCPPLLPRCIVVNRRAKCVRRVVPCGPVCKIYCRYGNVIKNGCPICKCKENPCNRKKCPPLLPRCIVVNRLARCVRTVVNKPGRCPRFSLLCRSVKWGCVSDRQCPGKKKCCRIGCASRCLTPIPVVKPGKCPRRRFVRCKSPVRRCRVDTDCWGRQKCCTVDLCGRRCVNPAPVIKPGKCPRTRRLIRCPPRYRRCKVDSDCIGRDKCCTVDKCGRRCVKPAPVIKPGKCPRRLFLGCLPPVRRCRVDSDCFGRRKCCSVDKCGSRCVNPAPVVKPGKCPRPRKILCKRIVNRCSTDADCKGAHKCCLIGCVRLCGPPRPDSVVKPGKCPRIRISYARRCRTVHRCRHDFDCRGRQKCCTVDRCGRKCVNPAPCGPICRIYCRYGNVIKNGCPICKCKENPCNRVKCPPRLPRCIVVNRLAKCVRPVVPVVKPGRCPRRPKIFCFRPVNLCSTDANCRGSQKCCIMGCGRRCVNPAPAVKPGKCPKISNARCKLRVHSCRGDLDCKGRQKCCTVDRCGRKCVNPVPVLKPGLCPNTSGIITPCVVSPLDCFSDTECLGRRKCCSFGCSRRCLVPAPALVGPVGPCPKPTGPGFCAELCGVGDKCSGGKICCFNGCGHQCMNPVKG